MKKKRIIGLLAGKGDLPRQIIAQCTARQQPFFLVAFEGQTDPELVSHYPHQWVRLGAVGEILACLKNHDVTHVVMAGGMRRPSWSELKLDWTGTQWLAKMGVKSAFGDDGLLKGVSQLLKEEGFEMLAPTDILQDLLAPEGVMGAHSPDKADWEDVERGKEVVRLLGLADVGQSVVVQQGLVLGVEAIEGTESLLERCANLRRGGRGGVLVKMTKPHQSRALDLPTIGIATVHQAHAAGLRGIAMEAGSTQILDQKAVIEAADVAGLYLVGISAS